MVEGVNGGDCVGKASTGTVTITTSLADADAAIASTSCVINICAEWCEPCVQMNIVFAELASENGKLHFLQVDADSLPELCERFELESVPAFLFFHGGALVDTVLGADAPALASKAKQQNLTASIHADGSAPTIVSEAPPASEPAKPPLEERLRALTHGSDVVVFMKGNPDAPRCGFSRQIVELLTAEKVKFGHFDILTDEEVRQGLKTYSNWPTYPQLYAEGKLVGGLDIVKELREEGELLDSLPASAIGA